MQTRARVVVNAAGGWTDVINQRAGIETPYRHIHSRGVSLAVARHASHHTHLIFDNGIAGNAMTLAPWGPVALWGSTDTIHESLDDARRVVPSDISFLLEQLNRHLASPVGVDDIVSVRCGVRPVAVPRERRVDVNHAQFLSRHHRICRDASMPWISVYGGKLSGCTTLAREVGRRVTDVIGPPDRPAPDDTARAEQPSPITPPTPFRFPTIDTTMPSPEFSASYEQCRTLEDFVRRRTNIAQWIPRGGFGRHDEHLDHLRQVATAIHRDDATAALVDLTRYRARVTNEWSVLEGAHA